MIASFGDSVNTAQGSSKDSVVRGFLGHGTEKWTKLTAEYAGIGAALVFGADLL